MLASTWSGSTTPSASESGTSGATRDRFDVHVCALTRGGPLAESLDAAGIPLTVIGKRRKLDPAAYWRLRQYIRRLAPESVRG